MQRSRRRWRSLFPVTALVASAVLAPLAAKADDQPASSTGQTCGDAGQSYETADTSFGFNASWNGSNPVPSPITCS